MKEVLEIFEKITKIPRCSKNTKKFKDFLCKCADDYGYKYDVDKASNVICYRKKREICLQAHYDMVCVGNAPAIKLQNDGEFLSAENSTLGADNGIGIAIMLYLMQKGYEAEFLFTNDEEVGLIGANQISLNLEAKKLLNLDFEEEGEVCIGCAGGVDIYTTQNLTYEKLKESFDFYEITTVGFSGGHSGVDIDKNIKNAIIELAKYLQSFDCRVVDIVGGEAINSIPKTVKAIIATKNKPQNVDFLEIKKTNSHESCIQSDKNLLQVLSNFKQGVWEFNQSLKIPQNSINLSKISIQEEKLQIDLFARSMDKVKMDELLVYCDSYFKKENFDVEYDSDFSAWEPKVTPFAKEVFSQMKKIYPKTSYKAIHAGLECGVLMDIYPNLDAASIGPTIELPHTTKERLKLSSVEKCTKVIENVLSLKYD